MRKAILSILGGAIFLLPLMFASCGNIDNPLEILDTSGSGGGGGGAEETTTISYVEYSVSGETATPTTKTLAEGAYIVVTADLAELTADKPYVVDKDITIGHDVTLSGNAKIIICDGKTLTVSGCFGDPNPFAETYSLDIYGQTSGTGTLKVTCAIADKSAIDAKVLKIHGVVINASSTGTDGKALLAEDMDIYKAKITATASVGNAQSMETAGNLKIYDGCDITTTGINQGIMAAKTYIYGGDVKANGGTMPSGAGGNATSGDLIISGGKLTAIGGDGVSVEGGDAIGFGIITVTGGEVYATGGLGDSAPNGNGISTFATIDLTGTILYENGTSVPTTEDDTYKAASQTGSAPNMRYAIIK